MNELQVGEWVCVNVNGLKLNPFDFEQYSWKTKKKLIEDISAAHCDAARTPKVKRKSAGHYEYIPKSCDTGHYLYYGSYDVILLTEENIEDYRKMLESAISEDAASEDTE